MSRSALSFGKLTQNAGAIAAAALIAAHSASASATGERGSQVQRDAISRTHDEKIIVRALPLDEPLRIDGQLNEAIYQRLPPIHGFIQQEPLEGQPATEDTDLWFLFDRENLYIAARCWDSHPEREIANEMRRDHSNLAQNESLTFV